MSDNGSAEQFGEALRAALLAGRFPNPNHEGCPEDGLLKRMAARQGILPVGDPTHVHIMQCSPCYLRLEGYRAANRRRRAIAAAAAVFLVLAAGYGAYRWWPSTQAQFAHNQPAIIQSELDLRPYTVERSDQPASNVPQPLRLTPTRVQVVILLPVGVEPGPYELRILDSDLKTRVSTAASAKLGNFQTTIQTTMNLQALPIGKYMLAMRRAGDDWRQYPLFIGPAK
jgi:hypothetical protein